MSDTYTRTQHQNPNVERRIEAFHRIAHPGCFSISVFRKDCLRATLEYLAELDLLRSSASWRPSSSDSFEGLAFRCEGPSAQTRSECSASMAFTSRS